MEFPNIVETKSKGEKMYLISAYFDEHTTRQLQRFIDAVAQNTGNTYMIDNNVPPHLTICYLCDARIGFAFAANSRKGL